MEFKVKNREWVKSAAIVFLTVLLVLTFFSNTIMNRTLAEVATANVASGTITAKVRGSGKVTAVGNSEVKIKQSRVIRSVMCKVGQEVKTGDVLFVLGEGESTELEEAEKELRRLENSLKRAQINSPSFNYTSYYNAIERATRNLRDAEEKCAQAERLWRSSIVKDGDKYAEKQEEIKRIDKAIEACDTEIEQLQSESKTGYGNITEKIIVSIPGGKTYPEMMRGTVYEQLLIDVEIVRREEEIDDGERESPEDSGTTGGSGNAGDSGSTTDSGTTGSTGSSEGETYDAQVDDSAEGSTLRITRGNSGGVVLLSNGGSSLVREYELKIIELERKLPHIDGVLYWNANEYTAKMDEKMDVVRSRKVQYTERKHELENGLGDSAYKAQYDAAERAVDDAKDALEDAEAALYQAQIANGKTSALSNLDLQEIYDQISDQREKIDKLSGDSDNQVLANVNGIVTSISYISGQTAEANSVLCTIEVEDMGYMLSFSVTNEQAQRLRVGDTATISNYYWGKEIVATLTSIRNDPKNPQGSKILNFSLEGEVTSGSDLTISVGSKSAVYDTIIPNSAIRTDSNGSFVLAVTAKSSPLGNRYTAKRVSVDVIAQDDENAAVTGGIAAGDFVITTSNAPVVSGDMVRMADTNS